MDRNIKRASEPRLALKGLQTFQSGGDLKVAYQAAKTLDIKEDDPGKNYANLQKAVGKLFTNYPPSQGKK